MQQIFFDGWMQYVVAWLSVRSDRVQQLVKSEPVLLVRRGEFLDAALRGERVTRAEVFAAVRSTALRNLRPLTR